MATLPHILIVGAGAIGSFYGAILKRAGCPVSAVVRSEFEAVKAHGFQFESPLGDISWRPDKVYRDGDRPETPPDYLILATKVVPGADRVALIRPWIAEDTQLVLIQNGIDIERETADAFPEHALTSGVAYVAVSRVGPGKVKHNAYGRLVMGNYPGGVDAGTERLAELLRVGGIEAPLAEDIVNERWLKCIWNTALNPLAVLANGADNATMLDSEGGEALVRALMSEVIATARAEGYDLPEQKLIDGNIRGTRKMPTVKNSMAMDYLNGRPIELDAILGNVVAIARRRGVGVPRLETVLATLRMRQ
jgi:2-dehydropantoate 2-reductase